MKPLISYYGGKQRIAPKIVEVIKTVKHTVYAESFAGGLAVLYEKTGLYKNSSNYREIINDNSEFLMNLYRVARNNPEEFHRLIAFTPYSQSDHKTVIDWMKNPTDHSELELAWAYYVNINTSFVNQLNKGWGTGVYGRNLAYSWNNRKFNLYEALERLGDVHIACEDALRFIERWDSPQTLFYCDPPYINTDKGHYSQYTQDDWIALCDLLDSIQGSYILSNYNQDYEPRSYDKKLTFDTASTALSTGKVHKARDRSRKSDAADIGNFKRTEVLWVCDRSGNMRSELKKIDNTVNQLDLFS